MVAALPSLTACSLRDCHSLSVLALDPSTELGKLSRHVVHANPFREGGGEKRAPYPHTPAKTQSTATNTQLTALSPAVPLALGGWRALVHSLLPLCLSCGEEAT